jgi:hypothetical protein
VSKRIENKEIDPKNESFGVKLGTYKMENQQDNVRYCC